MHDTMVIYNDDDDDDGDDVDGYGDVDDDDNDGDYDWRGVGNDYGDDGDDDNYDDDDDDGDNDDNDDDEIFVKFSQNVGPFIAKSGLFAPFWDFWGPPPLPAYWPARVEDVQLRRVAISDFLVYRGVTKSHKTGLEKGWIFKIFSKFWINVLNFVANFAKISFLMQNKLKFVQTLIE